MIAIKQHMVRPLFSVIIPTLNEEGFLPLLLRDLDRQTDHDFEVLVVDANSSDKTKESALRVKHTFPLAFFSLEKKDVAYQRNYGAAKAQGQYLFFLDADTRITSTFIKQAKKCIQKKGLLFIPYVLPDYENRKADVLFQVVNFAVETAILMGKPLSTGGQILIERHFFSTIGGFQTGLFMAEDHHIIQKAYAWGVRPKLVHNLKVRFSLRRMKREGRLQVLYKYFIVSAHFLLKGMVKERLFEYEMGGHLYKSTYLKRHMKGRSFNDLLRQMKRTFTVLLQEE